MQIHDGLTAFLWQEEVVVVPIVHEEVFCEDGRTGGVAEDVEVGFYVRVAVGVVGPEAHSGKVALGGFVQSGGEGICPGAEGEALALDWYGRHQGPLRGRPSVPGPPGRSHQEG